MGISGKCSLDSEESSTYKEHHRNSDPEIDVLQYHGDIQLKPVSSTVCLYSYQQVVFFFKCMVELQAEIRGLLFNLTTNIRDKY